MPSLMVAIRRSELCLKLLVKIRSSRLKITGQEFLPTPFPPYSMRSSRRKTTGWEWGFRSVVRLLKGMEDTFGLKTGPREARDFRLPYRSQRRRLVQVAKAKPPSFIG